MSGGTFVESRGVYICSTEVEKRVLRVLPPSIRLHPVDDDTATRSTSREAAHPLPEIAAFLGIFEPDMY